VLHRNTVAVAVLAPVVRQEAVDVRVEVPVREPDLQPRERLGVPARVLALDRGSHGGFPARSPRRA